MASENKLLTAKSAGSRAGYPGNPIWDRLLHSAIKGTTTSTSTTQQAAEETLSAASVICISSLVGCGICGGGYFAYHSAGALMDDLTDPRSIGGLGFSTTQVSWFLTIYSIPAFFMTVIGGWALTRWGPIKVCLSFSIFSGLLGTAIFAVAPYLTHEVSTLFVIMMIARFIIGIGGEVVIACRGTFCDLLFGGTRYLNLSVAVALFICQALGSAASFVALPVICSHQSLDLANWVTVMVVGFSVLCILAIKVLYGKQLGEAREAEEAAEIEQYAWFRGESPQMMEEETHTLGAIPARLWRTVVQADRTMWCIWIYIFSTISILYTYANFAPDFIVSKWGWNSSDAGYAASMIYWMMIFGPDGTPYRMQMHTLCTGGIITGLAIMRFTDVSPYIGMCILGFSFSMVEAACETMIIRLTLGDNSATGFAMGIYGLVLNMGLCIIPLVVASLEAGTGDYNGSLEFLIGLACLGLFAIVGAAATDTYGYLCSSAEEYETRLLLTKLFELIDTDNSDSISLEEDLSMCSKISLANGVTWTKQIEEACTKVFKEVDDNKDGVISLKEFLMQYKKIILSATPDNAWMGAERARIEVASAVKKQLEQLVDQAQP